MSENNRTNQDGPPIDKDITLGNIWEIISRFTFGTALAIVVGLASLLSLAFKLGMEQGGGGESSGTAYTYREFGHTDLDRLANWASDINASSDDLVASVSGNTFHVWARPGDRAGGEWVKDYEKWDEATANGVKDLINLGRLIVLGSSGEDFHFLRWNE